MDEPPDSPPKDPQAAACLGFVLAAIAGCFAAAAWVHWKHAAEALSAIPQAMRSGGANFSMNLTGLGLELAAFALGFSALVALGSTWLWRTAMLRTWYSIGGVLCLLPVMALLAGRFGWLHP